MVLTHSPVRRPLLYLSSKSRTTEDAITVTYEQTWKTTALFLQLFGKKSALEQKILSFNHVTPLVFHRKAGTYRFGSSWGWVNHDRSLFLGAASLKSEQLEQMKMMHLTSTSSCWYTVVLLLFFQRCRSFLSWQLWVSIFWVGIQSSESKCNVRKSLAMLSPSPLCWVLSRRVEFDWHRTTPSHICSDEKCCCSSLISPT